MWWEGQKEMTYDEYVLVCGLANELDTTEQEAVELYLDITNVTTMKNA